MINVTDYVVHCVSTTPVMITGAMCVHAPLPTIGTRLLPRVERRFPPAGRGKRIPGTVSRMGTTG